MTKHRISHHKNDLKLQVQYNKANYIIDTVPNFLLIIWCFLNFLESPKSINFISESFLSFIKRIFSGLISRWTMLFK